MLSELAKTGVDLVGVDPSMTLVYRAEYAKAMSSDALPTVALPQEWLAAHLDESPLVPMAPVGETDSPWWLLPHCTERTNAPAATEDWVQVGRHFGIDLRIASSGCCGMAGLYGHEATNRSTSEAIYGLSWGPMLADAGRAGRTLATGYSCRCQAEKLDGVQLLHPVQMLLRVLTSRQSQHA
jgi:Fe-S oxidoreductase